MHYCSLGLFYASAAFQPAAEDNQAGVNLTGEVDVSITEQLFFSHQQAWKTTRVTSCEDVCQKIEYIEVAALAPSGMKGHYQLGGRNITVNSYLTAFLLRLSLIHI